MYHQLCPFCGDFTRTKRVQHFGGRKHREGCCPEFLQWKYDVSLSEVINIPASTSAPCASHSAPQKNVQAGTNYPV